jgi:hypothetical protein
MKNYFLFSFLCISFSIHAQITVTLGPELTIGDGQFEDGHKVGVGVSAEYMAKVFPKGGIRVYTAYNRFPSQAGIEKVHFIPIRVGYEHFLYSDNLFVYGEAGIINFLFSSGNKTGLSIAGGTGYKINMPKATLLQFSLFYNYNRYNAAQNYNWLTLKAAYGFKFGERRAFKRED